MNNKQMQQFTPEMVDAITKTRLQQFVTDCTRTESPVQTVNANRAVLGIVISIMVAAGELLDQIKKNSFYNKPFNNDAFQQHIQTLEANIIAIKAVNDPNQITQAPININTRLFHAIVGIATESTELLQALKFDGQQLDNVNIMEELGDLQWYCGLGCDELDIDLLKVLTTAINKLQKRYPEKFTDEHAINRDLDSERQLLEDSAKDK